ncbi:MAG: DUF5320 domain-containing protein [Phycisphaerae bacterium]|nr:DUF5320 domain-containing protein [Phycisphaerae bacterium]
MPGFDGTGPRGSGPMSGGGRGFCVQPIPPTGGAPNPAAELAALRQQAKQLAAALSEIRRRIDALDAHGHAEAP